MTIAPPLMTNAYANKTNSAMASVINLSQYLTGSEKVLSEREQGADIRQQSNIDTLIQQVNEPEKLTIQLPEQIRSISPAFLEGFLGEAVRQYGRLGFRERVEFTKAERYDIADDLEEAIDRILTEQYALDF